MSITPEKALKLIEEAKRKNSTALDLPNCELTEFPSEILELTNLIWLLLQRNSLTTLPEAISIACFRSPRFTGTSCHDISGKM